MGYVRITIYLRDQTKRSGVRGFTDPMNLADIRKHAWQLAAETLGRGTIEDVQVEEVPAYDPAVVALILGEKRKSKQIPPSNGDHPYNRQQQRKPRH